MEIKKGDAIIICNGKNINIGFVNSPELSTSKSEFIENIFFITEITKTGEAHKVMKKSDVIAAKQLYNDILLEKDSSPLVHGINNGYQDW